jgi:hypothetical protein
MRQTVHFKIRTRSKLKFAPNIGTDVELPRENPVTQYLPTTAPNSDADNEESTLTGRKYPWAASTGSVKMYPSTSSVLRNTPTDSASRTVQPAPTAEAGASAIRAEAGNTKTRNIATDNFIGNEDVRRSINHNMIGMSPKKGAKGLMHNSETTSGDDYYRRVLNAL